jgi:hypothetical protein
MRRVFGYMVLFICIIIYFVSSCQKLTDKINHEKEKSTSPFASDKHRYGDLFGLAYLSAFKKPNKDSLKRPDCNFHQKIDLYAICDSYLFDFFDSSKFYCGIDKLTITKTNYKESLVAKLNPSKINVLLLEFSERNIRDLIADSDYVKSLITLHSEKKQQEKWSEKIKDFSHFLFNNMINVNLEYHLSDYSLLTPIKEFRADLNYKLFSSLDRNVKLSKNGKQLFYAITIDTTKASSSFECVSDHEIDIIIKRLNSIYSKAIKIGFNKMYLSIIPNPVSVIDPHYNNLKYNNLVNRIQNSNELKMPDIDIFPSFNRFKNSVYSTSDTHWNWNGAYIWLDKFNIELAKTIAENQKN